jgi:hypothetical protein
METAQPDRLEGISVENREPLHEAIAMRAYEYRRNEGDLKGSQEEDWFRSQDELPTRSGNPAIEKTFCKFWLAEATLSRF